MSRWDITGNKQNEKVFYDVIRCIINFSCGKCL